MNTLFWLDVSLAAYGLLAMSPLLWSFLRRGRAIRLCWFGRLMQAMEGPLFHTGVVGLALAGLDVGWGVLEKLYVFAHEDGKRAARMDLFPPNSEAPDFCLPSLEEDRQVRLSDFRGHKPVVLIFGSFGCNIFCEQVVGLRQLHEKYSDRAQFLLVYIRDAGHELPEGLRDLADEPEALPGSRPRLAQQATEISRPRLLRRARAGREFFGLDFPCLLDTEQMEVQLRYAAFPKRMLVVDTAGRIVVDSGNFIVDAFPWQETTDWLDRYVSSGRADD